tara:strand:- start:1815 stop:2018 length:204 start_codon:yes stop_codon:yes gene_type:complete
MSNEQIIETPPDHIFEAERTLSEWMNENGHKEWQLGGTCCRSFAGKLEETKNELADLELRVKLVLGD